MDDVPHSREERARRRQNTQAHKELLRAESEFDTVARSVYLRLILCSLRAVGNIAAIAATGSEVKDDSKPHGWRRIVDLCRYEECLWVGDEYNKDGLNTIWQMIVLADYPVRELELGSEDYGIPLRFFFELPALPSTLRDLRTLKIAVSPEQGGRASYLNRRSESEKIEDLAGFLQFVGSATGITNLSLSIDRAEKGSHFMLFALMAKWADVHAEIVKQHQLTLDERMLPNLVELELTRHHIEPSMLLAFIQQRSSTLQKIKLREIRDRGRIHDTICDDIKALICRDSSEVNVELIDCYDGIPWWPQ